MQYLHESDFGLSVVEVTVFLNSSDPIPDAWINPIRASENKGFLSWVLQEKIKTPVLLQIGEYLDSYLYGWPTEEALAFQNGVYTLTGNSNLEKILQVQTQEDIAEVIEKGKIKRNANKEIAAGRVRDATTIMYQGVQVLVGFGDSPIVDTCIALAEKAPSGIGILFRYNLKDKRTFISVRVTEGNSLRAGDIAQVLIGGGGSHSMGGGSTDGLIFPEELFASKRAQETPMKMVEGRMEKESP
jgi:hypothetical protein